MTPGVANSSAQERADEPTQNTSRQWLGHVHHQLGGIWEVCRDSQGFPAAGLRWMVLFEPGENHLELIAEKDGTIATDAITLTYQTNLGETRADGTCRDGPR